MALPRTNNWPGHPLPIPETLRSPLPDLPSAPRFPGELPRTRPARPWYAARWWAVVLLLAYPATALAPLLLLIATRQPGDHSHTTAVAMDLALLGYTLLSLQFLLAAKFRWIEAPFGLDRLMHFHRIMAILATGILLAHPLFLIPDFGTRLLTRLHTHWYFWLGRITALILLLHVIAAFLRKRIPLKYHTWQRLHAAAALLLLALGAIHSLAIGDDLATTPARLLWLTVPSVGLASWIYARLIRPHLLRSEKSGCLFTVLSVEPESPSATTLTLAPLGSAKPFHYLPGQFQFLRIFRNHRWSEEHPFTIASSPTSPDEISLTIKSLGPFTSQIPLLRPGDLATLHGPFGKFSYSLHPHERDLVFVAGGVGITPFISMLRHMNHTRDPRRVLLLYASRSPADILFQSELDEIQRDGFPQLTTIYILSDPTPDWAGKTGRLDAERLLSLSRGSIGKTFYFCCPPPMTRSLCRALKQRSVPSRNLRTDFFSI